MSKNNMENNNCFVCRKPTRNMLGQVLEGVCQYGLFEFCSDKCYKIWKTRNKLSKSSASDKEKKS